MADATTAAAAGPAHRAGPLRRLADQFSPQAWLLLPPMLLLSLLFLLPLAVVLGQSFSAEAGRFDAYRRVLTEGGSLQSLLYTFRVAAAVTLLALVLAFPVAFLISRAEGLLQMALMALVLVPFWTSAVIRSYAWLIMLQRRGVLNEVLSALNLIERPLRLANTETSLHLAMTQVMLPFMVLPLINAMRNIDPAVMRAASILGANPARQFFSVYLPLSMPGVWAGCALVFISSLGFYITPALLGSTGTMAAVLIEQQVSRTLDWPLASALATLLLVGTCLIFLAVDRLRALSARMGGRG